MQSLEKLKEITQSGSILILSADDFLARKFNLAEGHIPMYIYDIANATKVKDKLLKMYGGEAKAIAFPAGIKTDIQSLADPRELVVMPIANFIDKKVYTFGDLLEIIRRLRDDDGCPWDKAQTHKSIRSCAIEEAYELAEAVDMDSKEKMLEESGDVLLQGVFHSTIAEEKGEFSTTDMISALCTKLVTRHTHIFGENKAHNAEEALGFWEQAKAKEKSQKGPMDKINSIPTTFSALMTACKVQKYAAKAKFDYPDVSFAEEALLSELKEFKAATTPEEKENEGGDILFSVVNILRLHKVDPEIALNSTTKKFLRRFEYVMKRQEECGVSLEDVTLDQLEGWYQEYKKIEKKA